MARGDLKTSRAGSRTPFQILADYYQTGDTRDRELWHEYSRVTRSLAAVRWSRGLRAAILGSTAVPERTDLKLAAAEVGGELVTAVAIVSWSHARVVGLELAILVAAECGGQAAAEALIDNAHMERPVTHYRHDAPSMLLSALIGT
jgi:hypothetical protein